MPKPAANRAAQAREPARSRHPCRRAGRGSAATAAAPPAGRCPGRARCALRNAAERLQSRRSRRCSTGVYSNLSQDPTRYGLAGFALGEDVSPGPARLRPGRIRVHAGGECRPSVRRQPHRRADTRQHGIGRRSVRVRDRTGLRPRAQVRPLLLGHRLPERAAPARLGFLRRAARLPGVSRRPVLRPMACSSSGLRRPTSSSSSAPRSAMATAFRAASAIATASAPPAYSCTPAATSARAIAGARDSRTSTRAPTAARRRSSTPPATLRRRASPARAASPIADFVWKYAPNGNAQQTNFKLQGEYFWRREHGDLTYDADGALGLTQTRAVFVDAERRLSAGRVAVHADVARRRALRPARSRHAPTTAPTTRCSRCRFPSATLHVHGRLDAVRVQPVARCNTRATRCGPT